MAFVEKMIKTVVKNVNKNVKVKLDEEIIDTSKKFSVFTKVKPL